MIIQIIFLTFGTIITNIANAVLAPLFIDSFINGNHKSNSYFTVIFSIIWQILVFIIVSYFKKIKVKTFNWDLHKSFIFLALFWTINLICILFSSSETKTPVDLQAILSQIGLPFTVLFSYYMKKEVLNKFEKIGIVIVLIGISMSLIPNFIQLGTHTFTIINLFWCCMFIIGVLFYGLSTVYMDIMFNKYKNELNIYQLIIYTNTYQLIFTILLFWLNIIPYFGNNSSLNNFIEEFIYGFKCFFYECKYTGMYGTIWNIIANLNFLFTVLLIKYISGNYMALISSISSPLSISVWLVLGIKFNLINIIMDYIGCLWIILGIVIFILNNEKVNKQEILNEYVDSLQIEELNDMKV